MPLYCKWTRAKLKDGADAAPTLVFLHGLLGNHQDWQKVIDSLSNSFNCLTIDLPGHGNSHTIKPVNFNVVDTLLHETLMNEQVQDYVLIGYSLGARVSMFHACHQFNRSLKGLILEGGHFGLPMGEREARWINDVGWAERFRQESIISVLADWYQQAVFSSLTLAQCEALIAYRQYNDGNGVADMLLATSLSKQPELRDKLEQLTIPTHYIYGEWDHKFQRLAQEAHLKSHGVSDAGHNVHVENPKGFCIVINHIMTMIGK